ncbi:unnamed protein product [Leptidea sinapis]|uniref:Uncharacterized protein n=1 Tax=Leptidea sinapis TaxID=189913 RepID=A0A5E4QJT9_9NEOP|nr:unnamed protein product [Leptidea sinapis]
MTQLFKTAALIFVIISVIISTQCEFILKGKVKKRNTIIKIENGFSPKCSSNVSIFENIDELRRIVFSSKYIFTGKISRVETRKRAVGKSKSVFKVLIK